MLSLREPIDKKKYIAVTDFELNFWLQRNNFHPRYMYENIYYYYKGKKIQHAIKVYEMIQRESEVSKFGKDI